MKRFARIALHLSLVFGVAVHGPGCVGTPALGPSQVVRRAVAAQGSLRSVRMEMDTALEFQSGPDGPPRASSFYRGEGYFERPDKSKMTVKTTAGEVQVVTIGDRVYVKQPGSSIWTLKDVSEYTAGGFSPGEVTDYLRNTENLRKIDETEERYRLGFDVDMGRYARSAGIPGVDPSALRGVKAHMEVKVLKDSFYVEEARMTLKGNLAKVGLGRVSVSIEVEFSEFNRPVTIEAPM